jgi:hypothetical protein
MTVLLSVDRFEGVRKETAVLVTDDGRQIDFPRKLLPRGVKAGDVMTFDIARDADDTPNIRRSAARRVE